MISRTATDRIIRTHCPLCGSEIDVHGQVSAEWIDALPFDGQAWVHEQHEPTVARVGTRRIA